MSDEHKLSSSTSSRRSRRGKSMTDAAFLPDGGLSEPSLAVSGPSYKDPAEGRLDASFDDAIPLPAADVPAPESPVIIKNSMVYSCSPTNFTSHSSATPVSRNTVS